MHGMFAKADTSYDIAFNKFIASLYESGVVPPVMVFDDLPQDGQRKFYLHTGRVAVLSEDEDAECAVFGNWGTYYEFEGWLAYRSLSGEGNEFQLMVSDVLNTAEWAPDTVKWISIIHGLVTVQDAYADKFGHYPADLNKFIKSYIRYGVDTVLLADRY